MKMQTADRALEKGDPSLERLLLFSDGVFAIAITLLAIELHVPEGWDGRWASLWAERWPMFTAFALSFAIIGIFWNAHRRVFVNMVRFSKGVMIFNMLVLAGVVLMPFATTLLYEQPRGGDGAWIYLALVTGLGLMHSATFGYAAFIDDSIRPRQHWSVSVAAMLVQALTPGLACGLSFFLIGQGTGVFAVITGAVLGLLFLSRVLIHRRFAKAAP